MSGEPGDDTQIQRRLRRGIPAARAELGVEQREWLDRMAAHIATSLAIRAADLEIAWFSQQGSLGGAHALFGDKLEPLLDELNTRLAA